MTAKLSAYSFATDLSGQGYSFGCTEHQAAAVLRRIADDLVESRALVKSATVVSKARVDEFAETVIVLRLHERTPPTPGV